MAFLRRHLPEWPYIEGTQRISLREIIFREVCLNILIHREFGGQHEASLVIYNDRVETCNWNIPFGYGPINLSNLHPHAKNPTIANFFTQLGIVEELGRGIRVMFNYVPLISSGRKPIMDSSDEEAVRRAVEQDRQSVNRAREAWQKACGKKAASRRSSVFYRLWRGI
ncbi:ATP-binding protein [Fibrobacter sp.]|uniref:ATP-binding protein n=1 Tax=Fibrobacter sp. TaxID=35828 RepID=UPI003890E946